MCPLPVCQGNPVPDMSAAGQCRDRPSLLDTPGMNASAPPPPKPWAKGRAHHTLHGVQTVPLLEANRSCYHIAEQTKEESKKRQRTWVVQGGYHLYGSRQIGGH